MRCDHSNTCVGKISNVSITIDTNFVINLINAIPATLPRNLSQANLNDRFLAQFGMYLYKFCKCPSTDFLITSDKILTTELDPRKFNAAIIRNSPFLRSYYIGNRLTTAGTQTFITNVWTQIANAVKPIPVSREELNAIDGYLDRRYLDPETGLSPEDRSLIVSSLKQSMNDNTVIVTSDLKLESALKDIIGLGNVTLPQLGEIATNRMLPITVQSYVNCIHSCCEMSNAENYPIYWHLFTGDIDRVEEFGHKVLAVKTTRLTTMAKEHEKVVSYKVAKELAAKLRKIQ